MLLAERYKQISQSVTNDLKEAADRVVGMIWMEIASLIMEEAKLRDIDAKFSIDVKKIMSNNRDVSRSFSAAYTTQEKAFRLSNMVVQLVKYKLQEEGFLVESGSFDGAGQLELSVDMSKLVGPESRVEPAS